MLIDTAPYIDFRLHRTRSDNVKVQNRYLEQVVVGTGNLSASGFEDSSHKCENVFHLDAPPEAQGNLTPMVDVH
jgi:hypothetical protein